MGLKLSIPPALSGPGTAMRPHGDPQHCSPSCRHQQGPELASTLLPTMAHPTHGLITHQLPAQLIKNNNLLGFSSPKLRLFPRDE